MKAKGAAVIDELPRIEPIRTRRNARFESIKVIRARLRKAPRCYKKAYAHKQALTACSTLVKQGERADLRVYKCRRCNFWHLTHQPERPAAKSS